MTADHVGWLPRSAEKTALFWRIFSLKAIAARSGHKENAWVFGLEPIGKNP
jgi:hypothetical protein